MRGVEQVIQMLAVANILDVEPEVINMARRLLIQPPEKKLEGLREIREYMVETQLSNTWAIYAVATELVHADEALRGCCDD